MDNLCTHPFLTVFVLHNPFVILILSLELAFGPWFWWSLLGVTDETVDVEFHIESFRHQDISQEYPMSFSFGQLTYSVGAPPMCFHLFYAPEFQARWVLIMFDFEMEGYIMIHISQVDVLYVFPYPNF